MPRKNRSIHITPIDQFVFCWNHSMSMWTSTSVPWRDPGRLKGPPPRPLDVEIQQISRKEPSSPVITLQHPDNPNPWTKTPRFLPMHCRISDPGPASTQDRDWMQPRQNKACRYHHHQPYPPYLGLEHMPVSASDVQQPARVEFGHALHQAPKKAPSPLPLPPPSSLLPTPPPTHTHDSPVQTGTLRGDWSFSCVQRDCRTFPAPRQPHEFWDPFPATARNSTTCVHCASSCEGVASARRTGQE